MEMHRAQKPWSQNVVLVVMDLSKDVSSCAINWALSNVARNGDILRLLGIITHVQNSMGFKSRIDSNTWNGASRKTLETEIENKRCMLQNINNLDNKCKKAGVQLTIEVCVGQNPKTIVVEEAKNSGAYHVVVDKTMKKDRKYFIDNLTCFVTRVRASGGAESIRSFAVSKPTPQPPAGGPTPFNTLCSSFYISSQSSSYTKNLSTNDSLRGSSVSSTTFNQDFKECKERMGLPTTTKRNSMASTNSTSISSFSMTFDTISSCDDLFSISHETISERDASLCGSELTTSDHNNAGGSGVMSTRVDTKVDGPRNTIPRPQWNARSSAPQFDESLKLSSGLSSSQLSHGLPIRSSMNRNSALSRTSSGNASSVCGRSEGCGRSLGSTRSTASGVSAGSGWSGGSIRSAGTVRPAMRQAVTISKTVWVWTTSKDVMTASVEGGWSTFIFTNETMDLANEWTSLAKINPLYLEDCQFLNSENKQVAILGQVGSSEELDILSDLMAKAKIVVMDALDWQCHGQQIFPAENMVAAFLGSNTALYAIASTASDAQLYLEALEKGADGIVLHTDDITEVFALKAYLKDQKSSTTNISLVEATVTQVESVGMGDRVCVDLCNLLNPGEGLLVGSFARALFLVHSECLESNYVSSRPFRVNAGPVHAYVGMAGGYTAYLSELHTGSQVMVVDAMGNTRPVLVGRVKIESRPLLLVEVEVGGQRHSVLLQNAETVCLCSSQDGNTAKALPVTCLKVGDRLLLSLQDEARHTGVQIQDFLVEK